MNMNDNDDHNCTESLLDEGVGDVVAEGGRLAGSAGAGAQTTRGLLRDTVELQGCRSCLTPSSQRRQAQTDCPG